MNRKRIKIGRSPWLGRSRAKCRVSDAFRSAEQSLGASRDESVGLKNGGSHHHNPVLRSSVAGPVSGMRIRRKYKTHKA